MIFNSAVHPSIFYLSGERCHDAKHVSEPVVADYEIFASNQALVFIPTNFLTTQCGSRFQNRQEVHAYHITYNYDFNSIQTPYSHLHGVLVGYGFNLWIDATQCNFAFEFNREVILGELFAPLRHKWSLSSTKKL